MSDKGKMVRDPQTGEERWLPYLEPAPPGWAEHPRKKMLMTPWLVLLGGIFAFIVPTITATLLQTLAFNPPVSDEWAPLSDQAIRGRQVYLANGCVYCHSGFTRPQDVRNGVLYMYPRTSYPGDYATNDSGPNTFGTARIGPDLTFEGGQHPDDWQRAHYSDPRFVEPMSIMPRFSFLTDEEVNALKAFVQERGGKAGLLHYASQLYMKDLFLAANNFPRPPESMRKAQDTPMSYVAEFNGPKAPESPTGTVDGLSWPDPINLNHVDRGYWLMDNPLPVTTNNLVRGRMIFQERCIGCHGEGGAAISNGARFMQPMPLPFVTADDQSGGGDTAPGDFYYRILRGIPGTAMENFGTRLKVDDIWRVVLFLKTIANGGLKPDVVPTPDMYIQWQPPPDFAEYVSKHPVDQNEQLLEATKTTDPFMLEAQRVMPGLNRNDKFTLAGWGEISLQAIRDGIEKRYRELLDRNYREYEARGGFPSVSQEQKAALPDIREEMR